MGWLWIFCLLVEEEFGDLNGVEGCAFAELVAADEEAQRLTGRVGDVGADAADEDVVLVGGVNGGGEFIVGAVVDDGDAGGLGEQFLGMGFVDLVFKFDEDRLGMRAHDGDADAGGGDLGFVVAPDLVGFADHLHFFLVVAVLVHVGVVAEEVEGVLLLEELGLGLFACEDVAGLVFEFLHALVARAGGGLIGRNVHALDLEGFMEGGECDDHDDGGAVGVGDDAALAAAALAGGRVAHLPAL